jgi:hypothetical protein
VLKRLCDEVFVSPIIRCREYARIYIYFTRIKIQSLIRPSKYTLTSCASQKETNLDPPL